MEVLLKINIFHLLLNQELDLSGSFSQSENSFFRPNCQIFLYISVTHEDMFLPKKIRILVSQKSWRPNGGRANKTSGP